MAALLLKTCFISKRASRVPQGPVDLGSGTTEGSFSSPRNRTHEALRYEFEKCNALLGNKKRISRGYPFLNNKSARRVPQGPVDLGFGTTEESFSAPRNRTHEALRHEFEKCNAFLGNKKGHPEDILFLIIRARDGDRTRSRTLLFGW